MTDQPSKRITIAPPSATTILAARHLDATEGRVQVGTTVDSATRAAITQVLRYVSTAHNSPTSDIPASTAPAAAAHPIVRGHCPACRGESLFLGSGGHVTCARLDCPDPCAADKQLHGEHGQLEIANRALNTAALEAVERAERTEAKRDGAYRERAHLLAWLTALHPAVIASAPDVDEPGWQILYVYAGNWQMSWHIAPRDAELFSRIEHVSASDRRAQWDGHTTDAKYTRIRQHTRVLQLRGQEPYERCICSSTMAGLELCARCPGHDQPDDTDLTEDDVDRMVAASTPVQIVTKPPTTFAAEPNTSSLEFHTFGEAPLVVTEPCAGFPDRCPNPVDAPAQSPYHGGGVRCGCGDQPKEQS